MVDSLVNMVVNMLASNGWLDALGHLSTTLDASALELTGLLLKTSLDGGSISVAVFTIFHGGHVVDVFFRENLSILDGLDGGVVMVLVDLTVNGRLNILVALLHDLLLNNGRSDLLVDGGVWIMSILSSKSLWFRACNTMVTGLVPVVTESVLPRPSWCIRG